MSSLLLLLVAAGLSLGASVSRHDVTPPTFVIDLDLLSEHRWDHILPKYLDVAKEAHKVILDYIPEEVLPFVETIAADINAYLPLEYCLEIKGVARVLNTSLGDAVLANLAYEIFALCTSIVCQSPDGAIWHVRNMDFRYAEALRPATIKVDYQRNGTTVYSGITWAGYVGLLTGQRPDGFSITVDGRNGGDWWMDLLVAILDQTAKPIGFLIRDTLATSKTYAEAVTVLSETDTEAEAYFIVGGIRRGEGVVITKSRLGSDDLWYMNEASPGWFLVETNYDHWVAPPSSDNRRDPAVKAMKAMGPGNINVTNLYDVISTIPVLNNDTVYSVVMSAGKAEMMTSWIRYP